MTRQNRNIALVIAGTLLMALGLAAFKHWHKPSAPAIDLTPMMRALVAQKFDEPDKVQLRNVYNPTPIGLCGEASGMLGGRDTGFTPFYAQNTGLDKWIVTFDREFIGQMCRHGHGK